MMQEPGNRRTTPAAASRRRLDGVGLCCLALSLALALSAGETAAETARLVLIDGDVVSGEVIERTDTHVVLRHAVLGELRVPVAQLSAASTHPGILGTGFLARWDKEVSVGITGSQGDTDETDARIGMLLQYADDERRWRIDGRYEIGYSEGDLDDHDATINALRDWLWKESRWFAFAYGLYDYDDFEAWKHRLTFGAGPGYRLIPEGAFTLDARFGPFFTYEFGDEDNPRPELAGGLFANWVVRRAHTLTLANVYFQTLDEAELRNVTRFEWKIRPAGFQHLSLKLGAYNEYDSASRKSKNNINYFTMLGWDF